MKNSSRFVWRDKDTSFKLINEQVGCYISSMFSTSQFNFGRLLTVSSGLKVPSRKINTTRLFTLYITIFYIYIPKVDGSALLRIYFSWLAQNLVKYSATFGWKLSKYVCISVCFCLWYSRSPGRPLSSCSCCRAHRVVHRCRQHLGGGGNPQDQMEAWSSTARGTANKVSDIPLHHLALCIYSSDTYYFSTHFCISGHTWDVLSWGMSDRKVVKMGNWNPMNERCRKL